MKRVYVDPWIWKHDSRVSRAVRLQALVIVLLGCLMLLAACEATKKTHTSTATVEQAIKDNDLEGVKAYADDMDQFDGPAFGRKYLMLAASYGHVEIVKYILDNGGDPGPYVRKNLDAPLHYAAGGNHVEVIEVLLDAGADINARDSFGKTPLHWTADTDAVDAAELLLKKGADPAPWSKFGTPLENAIKKNNDAVELVLREYTSK